MTRAALALAALLPALGLPTAPGWTSRTTGPTDPAVVAPQVWATTQQDTRGLVPLDVFQGLKRLRRDQIEVWASVAGRGAPNRTFTPSPWPLRLSTFRLDHGWEGQPAPNVQQRLRWAGVRGWHVDVRVYFGTQHPSRALVARAQAELDRLQLP